VRAQQNRELLEHVTPKGVVKLEERDVIQQGFPPELSVDAVFLDLPSPWLAVGNARKILKSNGKLCTFSPSIEQVTKNTTAMRSEGFHEIKTVEVMLKPWGLDLPKQIGEKRKRSSKGQSFQLPMRGHTSYLTFAIKQLDDEAQYPKPVLSLAKVTRLARTLLEGVKEEKKDILPVSLEM
jgi:tRNA (adenine57-N1/adenine58-N1)-methyltransferase